jgi:hypothetical protein
MAALAQFFVLFLFVRGILLMLDGDRRSREDRLREEFREELRKRDDPVRRAALISLGHIVE